MLLLLYYASRQYDEMSYAVIRVFLIFLALLDFVSRATVMAQASVVRPSVVVNSSFSETAAWIQAKLGHMRWKFISLFISLFLAISQVLKILWHFEIFTWESMGNLKCGISQKRLILERDGRKFRSRGVIVHICRVF